MQAQTMALQSIGVYIKRELVAGVPEESTPDEFIAGVTGVPVSGGGVGATFEPTDSALIYPDLMGSPSVVTKMSSNTTLETEYSGSPTILELLGGFLYSYASKAVHDVTPTDAINKYIGHRVNAKSTGITITADVLAGVPVFKIVSANPIFGAIGDDMRVVKYQWLWMDGFATAQTLRNNKAIQVYKYEDEDTIYVRQPLALAAGVANITFTGSMFRNGVPHKSIAPVVDPATGNVTGKSVPGDVHTTWTVIQDHPAADEPFVTRAAGATPESFALTVNSNSIVTTSFTLLNRGYLPIHYGKGTVGTAPDGTKLPYITSYNPLGNYPSISSATSRCAMYMNGIPKCVKDIAVNINGLSEAVYCVGDIGPTGATYNDMRPEVKATLYFSENIEIMNAIYNFATGTWSQINFTAQVGDTLGNVYCITVMNCAVTGDMPKVGKGVAEIQVSGKAGRFEDTDAINAGLLGGSVEEEMLPWIIQVDVMPKYKAP